MESYKKSEAALLDFLINKLSEPTLKKLLKVFASVEFQTMVKCEQALAEATSSSVSAPLAIRRVGHARRIVSTSDNINDDDTSDGDDDIFDDADQRSIAVTAAQAGYPPTSAAAAAAASGASIFAPIPVSGARHSAGGAASALKRSDSITSNLYNPDSVEFGGDQINVGSYDADDHGDDFYVEPVEEEAGRRGLRDARAVVRAAQRATQEQHSDDHDDDSVDPFTSDGKPPRSGW